MFYVCIKKNNPLHCVHIFILIQFLHRFYKFKERLTHNIIFNMLKKFQRHFHNLYAWNLVHNSPLILICSRWYNQYEIPSNTFEKELFSYVTSFCCIHTCTLDNHPKPSPRAKEHKSRNIWFMFFLDFCFFCWVTTMKWTRLRKKF